MTYENEVETRMDMGALFAAIFRRLPRILIVTALFLIGTYFLLNLVPAKYRSSASILVESRESVFTRANNATQPRQSGLDPSYVPSQIELIRSRDTLMKVIEKENLRDVAEFNGANTSLLGTILGLIRPAPNNQLSDERVLLAVAKNLKVSQLGGSRIITISFSSTDPILAAKIANSIANMHIMLRAELSVSDTVGATIWLEEEIKTMREQVANAEAKVAKYRIDNDLFVGSNNTNVLDQQ
ncbi:MAG: Wzz/FepE/Etk N-terminal domain-containing protein, partial [Devosiaceae bacterium]|nr:Wzz/FepE/Etk N-terminal domain-containing protein [Devosiaceae bacterium]